MTYNRISSLATIGASCLSLSFLLLPQTAWSDAHVPCRFSKKFPGGYTITTKPHTIDLMGEKTFSATSIFSTVFLEPIESRTHLHGDEHALSSGIIVVSFNIIEPDGSIVYRLPLVQKGQDSLYSTIILLEENPVDVSIGSPLGGSFVAESVDATKIAFSIDNLSSLSHTDLTFSGRSKNGVISFEETFNAFLLGNSVKHLIDHEVPKHMQSLTDAQYCIDENGERYELRVWTH